MNTEDKHKVNKYEREEKEKYRLRIASERGDNDDYDNISGKHNSTKDCSLQSSLEGATGAKNRVYRLGLYIYGQRSIPPSLRRSGGRERRPERVIRAPASLTSG